MITNESKVRLSAFAVDFALLLIIHATTKIRHFSRNAFVEAKLIYIFNQTN